MRRSTSMRQTPCFTKSISAFAIVMLISGSVCSKPASAQVSKAVKKPGTENQKVPGKIVAVERKGKVATLTVEKEGGEKLEVLVPSTKVTFGIVGKGDVAFIRPGTMVSTTAVQSQNQLFAKEFTVFLGSRTAPRVVQDPMKPTEYQVFGAVTAVDDDSVSLNFGPPAGVRKIMFDKAGDGIVVNVNSSDPALAVEGAAVEMEGLTRSGKFLPSGLTVTLADPLKADDVFNADAKAKTPPKTAASKPATKAGKAAEPAVDTSDPFGLLKKKDEKAKPEEKKPAEKKGT